MRAMILSAGYGTRLWPLTEDRTKPAIPILGKPLVGYVAEYLGQYGITDVIVNLHHRPESVKRALGDGSEYGVTLTYVDEPVILGTSGALDNARDLLCDDTFIVVNGKIITDIDLTAALETHRRMSALATLVLMKNENRERFSVVETRHGMVARFGGMPVKDSFEMPLMFTGIQILEPRIFQYIPRGVFSHSTTDVYPQAIAKGERVAAHVAEGKWRELSTLQRYLDISIEMLREKGLPMHAGSNCKISSRADVRDSILWDDVDVLENARLERVVVADNVRIAAGEKINDAVVVPRTLVEGKSRPEKALPGLYQGENFVVPLSR